MCVTSGIPDDFMRDLQSLASHDCRIRLLRCDPMAGSAAAFNAALSQTPGKLLALLDPGDLLSKRALLVAMRELRAHPGSDLIFSDEDNVSREHRRFGPKFKPDWNQALMFSTDAVGRLALFRVGRLREIGGFGGGLTDHYDHELALRVAGASGAAKIHHVPEILYHRWTEPAKLTTGICSAAPAPSPTFPGASDASSAAGRRAIENLLAAQRIQATVVPTSSGQYQVDYALPSQSPCVSILVPTTGDRQLLQPCLTSLLSRTAYANYEVLLLVNEQHHSRLEGGSPLPALTADRVRTLWYPHRPFNYSWVNNWGAAHASGQLLCFLNDDTTVRTSDWLGRLVARTCLPGVAAAGPLLLYPNGTIQQAGVILGLGGIAGHACQGLAGDDSGYLDRARLEQDVSCLTAACLVMRKSAFQEVGGFDEALPIAYNDVDLCLRLRQGGWRLIWTPTAELYHHESASAGRHDSSARRAEFKSAVALMRKRWATTLDQDPYYNRNLSLRSAYHLAFPPRRK